MKPFLLLAACLLALPALAEDFAGLLKGGPGELFDEADVRLFLDAAYKTLDQGVENQPLAWRTRRTAIAAT